VARSYWELKVKSLGSCLGDPTRGVSQQHIQAFLGPCVERPAPRVLGVEGSQAAQALSLQAVDGRALCRAG
jgi:hypothetical protein